MASNPPKLIGITLYLPNGQLKHFKAEEIAAYGVTPQGAVVATRKGETFTRYCNFPMVFHEELSSLVLPDPPGLPL